MSFALCSTPSGIRDGRTRLPRFLVPQSPLLDAFRQIVILRAGALGDFVLTLPALAALRRHYPFARLSLIARPEWGVLATRSGVVDQLIPLGSAWVSHLFAERVRGGRPQGAAPTVGAPAHRR
ncbi:MAG: hypothetical protein HYY04_15890 [Chloroflexi bacterium]|nr:hypothetical protein [Chloroflexota bacterium]